MPTLVFVANNPRFIENTPNNLVALWAADIKVRHDGKLSHFDGVHFFEQELRDSTTALIAGIEGASGRPFWLPPTSEPGAFEKQQAFVEFIRNLTNHRNSAMSRLSRLFTGTQYSAEARMTAAYIVCRGTSHNIGLGYFDGEQSYQRLGIAHDDEGWIESARATPHFDLVN